MAAFFSTARLVKRYMDAFTGSVQYDIEDLSSEDNLNYLERSFPANLGGQILHDCGVYALRSAYILLLSGINPVSTSTSTSFSSPTTSAW